VGKIGENEAESQESDAVNEERQAPDSSTPEPLLYGSYERALDAKGRFNVPFRFRKKDLGKEEEPPRFMITEDPQGVVSLMTRECYEESLQGALKQGRGRDQWHFLRWLATHSQEVPLDSQGRVAVPQKYLDRIGAGKRLLVLGVGKRMELWEPTRFESMQEATGKPGDEFFEVFYEH
jgi:MraZ protein